jgi:hypothetical protein
MDVSLTSWLSLDGHSNQAGDVCHLPQEVPFFHATHLPFPHHVPELISLQGPPRALEGKEAHPRLDHPFDEAVVLLNQVSEGLDQVSRSTCSASIPAALSEASAEGVAAFFSTWITRGADMVGLGSATAMGSATGSSTGQA